MRRKLTPSIFSSYDFCWGIHELTLSFRNDQTRPGTNNAEETFASSHPVSGTLFPLLFCLFHCTDFKLLSSLCNLSSPRLSSSSFRVSSPSWFPSASLLLLVLLLLPTTRSLTNGCLLPFRSSTRCSDTVWTRWLRFHADVVFFPLHAR